MIIKQRSINKQVYSDCMGYGFAEIIARILAGRVDRFDKNIIEISQKNVTPPKYLMDCPKAAERIAKAVTKGQNILVFTDYDADGCTSMAIIYRSMRDIFDVPESKLIQLTGHRIQDGYGLTDTITEQIIAKGPDIVITADVGSSDHEPLSKIKSAGIDVIVTDHHLIPQKGIPKGAYAVINPQREDCSYDERIAGCGVAWLLMTVISQELNCYEEAKNKLNSLLDFVALGTVADLAKLNSPINRWFVKKGLELINQRTRKCWQIALNDKEANVGTLGFQLGPIINASSRMSGRADSAIEFLTSNNLNEVLSAHAVIDQYNKTRRQIEQEMIQVAQEQYIDGASCMVVYHSSFNPGIQGVVASRMVEKFGIPAIMLANVEGTDYITGSGRAGQFLHLWDALQDINSRNPGLLISFGGHKAAAGLKFHKKDLETFKDEFYKSVDVQLKGQDTTPYIATDGSLMDNLTLESYYAVASLAPFGVRFQTPSFSDTMKVTDARMVGKNPVHLSMQLNEIKAMQFFSIDKPGDPMPVQVGDMVNIVYQIDENIWNGNRNLQLIVKKIY